MRSPLFLLSVMLVGCGNVATQREILDRSKIEVSRREPWSDNAFIIVEEVPDDFRVTWKVRAGEFDFSDYPESHGIRLIPGTERSLRFTRDGCLIRYADRTSRCTRRYYPAPAAVPPLESFPEPVK